MRLGFIGWYGHNNAGDERILYCLKRFFSRHEFVVTRGFGDAQARIDDLNRCDYVLLGGGGLILRGFGGHARLIYQLRPRFGCVGIGVEAVHKDNMSLLEAIKEKAEFILVRDEQSRTLLANHFKLIVGPDLTFMYPFNIVEPINADSCGLNLRQWYYWRCEHGGRHHHYMERLNRRFPGLQRVYPFAKWEPDKAFRIVEDNFSTVIPISLYYESETKTDWEVLGPAPDIVNGGFSEEYYKSCRYMVGMRLHSLIFSCQMGIPFISLSYQPKNKSFCEAVGMGEFSIELFDLSTLAVRIQEMKDSFTMIRKKLIEVRDEQRDECIRIMSRIRRIIED